MKATPNTPKRNNFINYLVILTAFFVLLFFTKNLYSDLQVQLDTREQKQKELQTKNATLSSLNTLKTELEAEDSEALKEVSAFTKPVSDKDILNYIYSYAQNVNLWNERLIIRSLSVSEWVKSDTGFLEASISISALFSSEKTLFSFLDFLVSPEAEYRFYLSSFNYPMNGPTGNLQVDIPLTIYYR